MYLRARSLLFILTVAVSSSEFLRFIRADVIANISLAEVTALAKLRPLVEAKLNKEYMKEDFYLVRFLRARDLNVQNAADMLLKTLVWRRENRMDDILNEVIGVEQSAPYTMGSFDRAFRPVAVLRLGRWDIRRVVLAGKRDKMILAMAKFLEQMTQSTIQSGLKHGKNITQFWLILDLNNLNVRENACLQCIPVGLELFNNYENNYPQGFYKIVGVNTPRIFDSLWTLVRPAMSKETKDIMFLFGYDQAEWRTELRKEIADEQIPVYLGGTYVENVAMRIKVSAA